MTKSLAKESNSPHIIISSEYDESPENSEISNTPIINLAPKKRTKPQYEKIKKWIESQIHKDTKHRKYKKSKFYKKKKANKRGQWSSQENKLLEGWVAVNGPKDWEACGRYIQGRSGKQCREHWNNCLNPELVKGDWTSEEDFLIMFFYEKCDGSWKKIIPLFNGRIENSIKNRFYSQLRKYATEHMTTKERKELCAKIKLVELKKYLNTALSRAKQDFLKKSKMTEEQFNNFLMENELKLKLNLSEYNDSNEGNLSTNLGESSLNEESDEDIILKKKRKRNDILLFEDFQDFNNLDYSFDIKSFDAFEDFEEKNESMNLYDDKDDIKDENNIDINDNIQINHIDTIINDNNNSMIDINEENENDLSMDCSEIISKNKFINLFKEYNFEYYPHEAEKNINNQEYIEGFKFAFINNNM